MSHSLCKHSMARDRASQNPLCFCRFLSWAQLLVDTSVSGTAGIPCYSQRTCEVALEGYGAACAVAVWPPLLSVPGTIQLGQVSTVSNPSIGPCHPPPLALQYA